MPWILRRKEGAALSLGAILMLSGTASAQVKLYPDQCVAALTIAEFIKKNHDISPRLIASFERFRASDCDIDTKFERDTETDINPWWHV